MTLLIIARTSKFILPLCNKGWMEPLPRVFYMLRYFDTILPSVKAKMRYILWVVALVEACDVTKNGRHLGFHQEVEIRLKPREIFFFLLD